MKIHDAIEQGTPEWFALRCGKATASEFASIIAKGQGKMRAGYLKRVVAEVLTGEATETYRNAHMDRGNEQEALARWAYELKTGLTTKRVGFIDHDTLRAGCSPDALIEGEERGAEIKCVIPTVQLDTVEGGYPSAHKAQIQGSMWITGYPVWDFCSYSPKMPKNLRLYCFEVERDDPYIDMLANEVGGFLLEVDRTLKRLGLVGVDTETLLRRSLEAA